MQGMADLYQVLRIKEFEQRCEALPCTRGMKVRARGDAFTLYREVPAEGGPPLRDERIRFTRISVHRYEISVLLHTGRWERTGMVGILDDLFELIEATMQHVVRDWSRSKEETPSKSTKRRKRKDG